MNDRLAKDRGAKDSEAKDSEAAKIVDRRDIPELRMVLVKRIFLVSFKLGVSLGSTPFYRSMQASSELVELKYIRLMRYSRVIIEYLE
jgi:hypothetical protein